MGVAAGLAVVLAVAVWRDRPAALPADAGGPMLPALATAVADAEAHAIAAEGPDGGGIPGAVAVARVEVAEAGGTTVIRRGAEGWVLPALYGYRADPAVVDRVVTQLAALERAAPLTRLPARFPLLGLAPVDAGAGARADGTGGDQPATAPGAAAQEGNAETPDATGGGGTDGEAPAEVSSAAPAAASEPTADATARARLTLYGADGAVLGDLLIGRSAPGAAAAGVYVRSAHDAGGRSVDPMEPVPAEARAWRAAGALDLPSSLVDWADRQVLALAPERLARLTVTRAGEPARLAIVPAGAARGGTDAAGNPVGDFRLEDPPPDRVVERAFRVDAVAETWADLRLTAVRPADFLADWPVWSQAQATTRDGLLVTLTQRRDPADPAALWLTVDAGAAPDAAAGTAQGAAAAAAAEAAAAEAAALAARTTGWAYRLPPPQADRLAATIHELTAPRAAAAEGPAAPPPPAVPGQPD